MQQDIVKHSEKAEAHAALGVPPCTQGNLVIRMPSAPACDLVTDVLKATNFGTGGVVGRPPVKKIGVKPNSRLAMSLPLLPIDGPEPDQICPPPVQLPSVAIRDADGQDKEDDIYYRCAVLAKKKQLQNQRSDAFQETRGMRVSAEKQALYSEIKHCTQNERSMEWRLQNDFVPQHSPSQFISPRAFFVSALFNAKNKAVSRQVRVELTFPHHCAGVPIRYEGPELRQSDARVFMALLNMLRDIRVNTLVNIDPAGVCVALFGRYDGNSRSLLRAHIQRLQQGFIVTDTFSVQICLGFEYPSQGAWSVALDRNIVQLFQVSPEVWLPMALRLELSDGLTSWLLTYIQSQTRLIPTKISALCELCGSDSELRAFTNNLRLALRTLAKKGVIDTGWSVRKGQVRWLKK